MNARRLVVLVVLFAILVVPGFVCLTFVRSINSSTTAHLGVFSEAVDLYDNDTRTIVMNCYGNKVLVDIYWDGEAAFEVDYLRLRLNGTVPVYVNGELAVLYDGDEVYAKVCDGVYSVGYLDFNLGTILRNEYPHMMMYQEGIRVSRASQNTRTN